MVMTYEGPERITLETAPDLLGIWLEREIANPQNPIHTLDESKNGGEWHQMLYVDTWMPVSYRTYVGLLDSLRGDSKSGRVYPRLGTELQINQLVMRGLLTSGYVGWRSHNSVQSTRTPRPAEFAAAMKTVILSQEGAVPDLHTLRQDNYGETIGYVRDGVSREDIAKRVFGIAVADLLTTEHAHNAIVWPGKSQPEIWMRAVRGDI